MRCPVHVGHEMVMQDPIPTRNGQWHKAKEQATKRYRCPVEGCACCEVIVIPQPEKPKRPLFPSQRQPSKWLDGPLTHKRDAK
jgi:hypothetical protein